jgi:hypothetical protein
VISLTENPFRFTIGESISADGKNATTCNTASSFTWVGTTWHIGGSTRLGTFEGAVFPFVFKLEATDGETLTTYGSDGWFGQKSVVSKIIYVSPKCDVLVSVNWGKEGTILSKDPTMDEEKYNTYLKMLLDAGIDTSKVRRVPQQPHPRNAAGSAI